MTREQLNYADEIFPLFTKMRKILDTAMYGMGDVSVDDPDYQRLRRTYSRICATIDAIENDR